jgi:uncharacterized protein (TIGR02996 family)
MTDTDALLAAILSDPADDTVRLAYADAIEEHGQHDRAEFIRCQIEIARIHGDPDCLHPLDIGPDLERKRLLRARERELFPVLYRDQLPGPFVPNLDGRVGRDAPHAHYSRGFVSSVTCTAANWLAHHGAIYWHPSQTVECTNCNGRGTYNIGVGYDFQLRFCHCYHRGKGGRIPRPFVATAQPIERVVFLEPPGVEFELPQVYPLLWNHNPAQVLPRASIERADS